MSAILDWPIEASDRHGTALWTASEIAEATGGSVAGGDFAVSGAATDSREVMDGDLFIALLGEAADGHRFVDGAFAKGAAGALVDRAVAHPHVLVGDTTLALDALGRTARARIDAEARVIGVTGSAGKTGVKEALYAALDRSSRGQAHRSVKSYNNHVGVPLSLVRMPARTRFGIFEMGMNHAGELAALTRLVRPHVAVVTTIAPAHIGHFSGEAAIAEAKAEIFEGLEPGGTAIIPADSPHVEVLAAAAGRHAARVVRFGTGADADVRLIDALPTAGGGTLVTTEFAASTGMARKLCYTVSQPGAHWAVNSLAVMAAVAAVGGDLGAAGLALAELPDLAGRGARHRIFAEDGDGSGSALLIDESYNANPASMRATIAQLGATPARRRLAVLGAMKELGEAGERYHAALAEPLVAAGVARVLLVGAEMAALADALGKIERSSLAAGIEFVHVPGAAAAAEIVASPDWAPQGGDAILIKGSNSVGLGVLVKALTQRGANTSDGRLATGDV
ncbi:UDP-N-acetylmuramoyl-tripeptide--D-alanyl-D-alanine ligase [Novosphingobium sp. Fuku2-ISO-50]|uniref:UDP-N-acetylmuramoyl-tripeptide--D-alanyl-D- alanine ligase n=1 Tax=Novosphingobium sp. Fuku2-ISO-50 TaxID=1739114 RepID=UPI00076BFF9D|nr:UDP-N-acetylmuramoyl-tripeptide--D-alanyl-D-alanine ligase [Novosphingobium sp. Fuku2-ISO-50]KUR81154.1 UDP-N-acetylmuramoylalanyl-D-glutamyl-2, 6-diaminopimelate--D-alanyl-D-alanine ligase [Novosphingobium sp. Fuku2-ISO-50]